MVTPEGVNMDIGGVGRVAVMAEGGRMRGSII